MAIRSIAEAQKLRASHVLGSAHASQRQPRVAAARTRRSAFLPARARPRSEHSDHGVRGACIGDHGVYDRRARAHCCDWNRGVADDRDRGASRVGNGAAGACREPPAPPQATNPAAETGLTPDTVASPEPPESTSTIKRDEVRAPPIKPGQSGPVGANGTSHPDASRIDQVRVLQPEVVRRCDAVYRRAPSATSPSRVTVTIEVVPTGAVHVLEVSGSDSALSACVVSQVSAWRLAHARATEHVRIAFRFTGNAAPREDVDIGF